MTRHIDEEDQQLLTDYYRIAFHRLSYFFLARHIEEEAHQQLKLLYCSFSSTILLFWWPGKLTRTRSCYFDFYFISFHRLSYYLDGQANWRGDTAATHRLLFYSLSSTILLFGWPGILTRRCSSCSDYYFISFHRLSYYLDGQAYWRGGTAAAHRLLFYFFSSTFLLFWWPGILTRRRSSCSPTTGTTGPGRRCWTTRPSTRGILWKFCISLYFFLSKIHEINCFVTFLN